MKLCLPCFSSQRAFADAPGIQSSISRGILLGALLSAGIASAGQAQTISLMMARPSEVARDNAKVVAEENMDAIVESSSSVGPVPGGMVRAAVVEPSQPDFAANPGRPAMATSALLTPIGFVQVETGSLFADESAQFSSRIGEEQTVRVTVTSRVQGILSAEPVATSDFDGRHVTQRGDTTGGVQVVAMPGVGVKPTISVSYLRLIRGGTASSLDIGGFANSALLMASADLGKFHVDANQFVNETEGPIRRVQTGEAVALTHPVTPRLSVTTELRHFTQPLNHSATWSNLSAVGFAVQPNLVLDTGLVYGFTGSSTRWQVASGITYVLPRRIWGFSHATSRAGM